MSNTELRFVLEDLESLEREHETNLRHGRALVPEIVASLALFAPCKLVLVHPDDASELDVDAQVVMISADGPMRGTAVQFDIAAPGLADRLRSFAQPVEPAQAEPDADAPSAPQVLSKLERIRKLSANERLKVAREGPLDQRVLVERFFGKSVWEPLLRNPQVTIPEVANIAKKGTAPRALLELIVDNAAWSRQSIVRRALLQNPRLSSEGITKVLRSAPKSELKALCQTTAYPVQVRATAKKLLGD